MSSIMSDALCSFCVISDTALMIAGSTLSHLLKAAIIRGRMPLPGSFPMYVKGSRSTCEGRLDTCLGRATLFSSYVIAMRGEVVSCTRIKFTIHESVNISSTSFHTKQASADPPHSQ